MGGGWGGVILGAGDYDNFATSIPVREYCLHLTLDRLFRLMGFQDIGIGKNVQQGHGTPSLNPKPQT